MSLEPKAKSGHRMNRSKPLNDVSALDLAYIAGIVDGEGCISITKIDISKNPRYRTKVSYRGYLTVTNTNRPLLEWLMVTTGVGNINRMNQRTERCKETWKWTVWSREATEIAKVLHPYLKIKAPQALNLIAFLERQRGPGGCNPHGLPKVITPGEIEFRERCYLTAKQMNQRGPIAA